MFVNSVVSMFVSPIKTIVPSNDVIIMANIVSVFSIQSNFSLETELGWYKVPVNDGLFFLYIISIHIPSMVVTVS